MKIKILCLCFLSSVLLGNFSKDAQAEWWTWSAWYSPAEGYPVACNEGVLVAFQVTTNGNYRIGCSRIPYAYLDQKCDNLGQCNSTHDMELKRLESDIINSLKIKNESLEKKLNDAITRIEALEVENHVNPKDSDNKSKK